MQIAQAVVEQLQPQDFESVTAMAPGFINLRVSGSFLQLLSGRNADRSGFRRRKGRNPKDGRGGLRRSQRGKPLHIGHLRSAIIGESMKRIYKFFGNRTIGDVHLGDWGLQDGPHHRSAAGSAAGFVLF